MSEVKFTSGPWEVEINEHEREITIQTEWDNSEELSYLLSTTKIVLADIYHGRDCTDLVEYEKAEANAHLIAAAPELYEALEYCIKQIPEFGDVPGIKAALAKARGEK